MVSSHLAYPNVPSLSCATAASHKTDAAYACFWFSPRIPCLTYLAYLRVCAPPMQEARWQMPVRPSAWSQSTSRYRLYDSVACARRFSLAQFSDDSCMCLRHITGVDLPISYLASLSKPRQISRKYQSKTAENCLSYECMRMLSILYADHVFVAFPNRRQACKLEPLNKDAVSLSSYPTYHYYESSTHTFCSAWLTWGW